MPKSIMEEMEGILTGRKAKRKARTLQEHVKVSRKAIGGQRVEIPEVGKVRVGGLRSEMRDQMAQARASASARSLATDPQASPPTARARTHPHAPVAGEFKHAEKAIRVHRNVIKAGEKGIRVSPKAMARRMAGRIAMLSKAGKPLARRLPFVGGLITAGAVSKGILETPSDAGRVIAREVFGINLPEKKKKKRKRQ